MSLPLSVPTNQEAAHKTSDPLLGDNGLVFSLLGAAEAAGLRCNCCNFLRQQLAVERRDDRLVTLQACTCPAPFSRLVHQASIRKKTAKNELFSLIYLQYL